MMVLFVMLNFTSSGGLFRPELQNGFFGTLHSFWHGAGFVEGVRSLLYFDGDGLSGNVGTLVGWLSVGLVVTAVAGVVERSRGRHAAQGPVVPERTQRPEPSTPRTADSQEEELEELEESVGV